MEDVWRGLTDFYGEVCITFWQRSGEVQWLKFRGCESASVLHCLWTTMDLFKRGAMAEDDVGDWWLEEAREV